jgi:hypothetical protein
MVIIDGEMMFTPEQIALRKKHIESIQEFDDQTLLYAYSWGHLDPNLDPFDPVVKAIIDSRLSEKLLRAATDLNAATERNHSAVEALVKSSNRMEWLTIVIGLFALVQLLIAGLQTWKMFQPEPERPVQVIVQPPPPTSPQTPVVPAPQSR